MAQVSNLHHASPPNSTRQPDPPPIEHPFESYNHTSFFADYRPSVFDSNEFQYFEYDEEDPNCFFDDPNCFFDENENDDEQMNFVTDLFESSNLVQQMGSGLSDDENLEFGFGPGLGIDLDQELGIDLDDERTESEFEFEVNPRVTVDDNGEINVRDGENDENDYAFEIYGNGNEREEFEWEEVSERFNFDERESVNSVINRIEELSVSVESSSRGEDEDEGMLGDDEGDEGEVEGGLEWEVLLEMNRNFEVGGLADGDEDDGSDVELEIRNEDAELPEDYILALEYDALFGQLVENESAVKGSPPASKIVVESLPVVVLRKEDGGEDDTKVVCAVCKDDVEFGERVTKMPCCHLYHGECIVPWLNIRNTCPVCRFELPTDDDDYERRKNETGGSRLSNFLVDDLENEVRYNFEFYP